MQPYFDKQTGEKFSPLLMFCNSLQARRPAAAAARSVNNNEVWIITQLPLRSLCGAERRRMKCHFILAIVVQFAKAASIANSSQANELDHDLLIKPCLDDLVANLIHHQDTDGEVLYQARASFELTPDLFDSVVRRAKKDLLDHEDDQRSFNEGESPSWPFLNGLGNLLFWNFAIPREQIHASPVMARSLANLQKRKDYISEMPSATSRGEVENAKLFCPDLTQAVLDRIDEDEESSLNVNKAQNIVAGSLERSLMTLFLHHYGWSQVYNWSWNPMKIAQNWRAWHSGMRLVYDTNMAALLRSKLCHEHLQGILC